LPIRPAGVVSRHLVSVGAWAVALSAWRLLPDASGRRNTSIDNGKGLDHFSQT
jgi:hypothetical protein